MPRYVDREQRNREVTAAAMAILADSGPAGLTLRSLADRLGGSITLVTHYYPTRSDLLAAITKQLIVDFDEDLAAREAGKTPTDRLRILLEWMLPLTAQLKRQELGRVMLVHERASEPEVQFFFAAMEKRMRDLIREHLEPLVRADMLDVYTDLVRVFANGMSLSVVEHPRKWTRKRQLSALRVFIDGMDLRREPLPAC